MAQNQDDPTNLDTDDEQREQEQDQEKPDQWCPGDLAPFWDSPFPNVLKQLSEKARNELKSLSDVVGNKDVAARRMEVEQAWEARLFDRGYQYLFPRRGGGWILPPFATGNNLAGTKRGSKSYGNETNIYATYGEIITAALTRDIPEVRFEPKNPESDVDVTAADAATKYARAFGRANDLLDLHQQLCYYLRTDGRAVIVMNHVIDAQRFGRLDPIEPVNPETETQEETALLYLVRHGETELNDAGIARGRSDVGLDNTGHSQSVEAGEWLKNKGVQRIISSPLPRAMESAEQIAAVTGAPVEFDDRLASMDIGEQEGQPTDDAGKVLSEHEDNPEEPMPGGESFAALDARVQEAIFSLLEASAGTQTAVVTHDSVISSVFRIIHGEYVPPADLVDPGGVAGIFTAPGGGLTVRPVYPNITPKGVLPAEKSDPRGEEIAEVYGKLEAKVPINAQKQEDCPYIQISKEYDFAYVKGMFPDYADKIKPGGSASGENNLDRIARINACLALEASYVTGDSMVRDCTVNRTWFRPGFFMQIEDKEVRQEFFKFFPDGCMVIYAGDTAVVARNENLDNHLTVVQAFPGSGMNRLALCSKLLSVQKRANNWMDLINAFFIRTIPQRVYDVDVFNMEAIQDQPSTPGDIIGVKLTGDKIGQPVTNFMAVEPSPTHQPALPDFIQSFLTDLPQLLSGALPSLFGSDSNQDTATGVAIQRDQALGRLASPWHSIQMSTCSYYRQAVQLAARCRKEPIRMAGEPGEAIRVELADLRGNLLAFPKNDSNFPESWNQEQARYQNLITDAGINPFVAQLLTLPQNAKFAQKMAGMEGFVVPQAEAWEKQLGEFQLLLKSAPLPNPQKMQAQMQLEQAASSSVPVDPQAVQQAIQQIQAMPEMISSVPIDEQCDDNATEAACSQWWLNSPEGRKYKSGTQMERDGYQNVRLHFIEHQTVNAKNAPQPPPKPMSVSANLKDMPPTAAAAELQRRGLPASPQEIVAAQGAKING